MRIPNSESRIPNSESRIPNLELRIPILRMVPKADATFFNKVIFWECTQALAAAQVEIAGLKTALVEQQSEMNRLAADVFVRDTLGGVLYKYLDADIKNLLREAILPNIPIAADGGLDEKALKVLIEKKAERFLKKAEKGSITMSGQNLPPKQRLTSKAYTTNQAERRYS